MLYDEVLNNRTRHVSVLVEELFQPHNTNAVLRSCECFGIQDVHVVESENPFDISTKISMGSHKWLDIHKYPNSTEAISSLKKQGYTVVATCLAEDAIQPDEYDIGQKSVFMFGTEKTGLSEEALEAADVKMKIPMRGFTESFNISVSAAILLHYFSNAIRAKEGLDWQLTKDEIDELKIAWIQNHVKGYEQMKQYYYEQVSNKT
jgi:tRNA (guanosine-2'-O-)-methyltransferase